MRGLARLEHMILLRDAKSIFLLGEPGAEDFADCVFFIIRTLFFVPLFSYSLVTRLRERSLLQDSKKAELKLELS